MSVAARIGDIQSGNGWFYLPSNAITGSPNVFINGCCAVRVGDFYFYGITQATGSSCVFINGCPAARIGDLTGCGSIISTGSHNVFIGG